jgi:2-methylcitrate dehydratase PrpD
MKSRSQYVYVAETNILAEFVATTELDEIPDNQLDHAKLAIRDYVGVAIYGSHHDVGDRITSYVSRCQSGGESTVLVRGDASPSGAALANGTFGHAIDYDDTFESIVIHPTSPIFPAALAVGEIGDGDGADVLLGYILGVETAYRVGHSTYPEHYENGWHSTGTIGSFGAVAAAASVLDLSPEETANAFGIVASTSSSLKKNFGTMTKPLHAGHAAEQGVKAALLAADGFTADGEILHGPLGYGEAMSPNNGYEPDVITNDIGVTWNVDDIGYKPYPSGVITHAAMEALRDLLLTHDLNADDIERVEVALDDAASEMLHHERPEDSLQAKFSIEFCLAAIMREKDAGVHEFSDEYVQQAKTQSHIKMVDRAFEENLFGGRFAGYGARVSVETKESETYTTEMHEAPGSPSNPISDTRLRSKFFECVETQFASNQAEEIAECIDSLESPQSLDEFLELVRKE